MKGSQSELETKTFNAPFDVYTGVARFQANLRKLLRAQQTVSLGAVAHCDLAFVVFPAKALLTADKVPKYFKVGKGDQAECLVTQI